LPPLNLLGATNFTHQTCLQLLTDELHSTENLLVCLYIYIKVHTPSSTLGITISKPKGKYNFNAADILMFRILKNSFANVAYYSTTYHQHRFRHTYYVAPLLHKIVLLPCC